MLDRRRVGQEGELPEADAAADAEGKLQVVAARLPGDRRQRGEEGPEVGDVLRLHPDVGGVGEGRVEVPPVRRDPAQHGVGEVAGATSRRCRPPGRWRCSATTKSPKAVFSTRPPPSLSRSSPFGLLRRVAGGAAAGPEPVSPRAASPAGSAASSAADSPRGMVKKPEGRRAGQQRARGARPAAAAPRPPQSSRR